MTKIVRTMRDLLESDDPAIRELAERMTARTIAEVAAIAERDERRAREARKLQDHERRLIERLGTPSGRQSPVKRSALVSRQKRNWPTIERDLKDASKNGLAEVAKADKQGWLEAEAIEWARSRGKYAAADQRAHQLQQSWPAGGRTHKLKG